MEALKLVGVVILVIGLAYGGWMLKRTINYSWDYESKVVETIEKKYEQRIVALETKIKALEQK